MCESKFLRCAHCGNLVGMVHNAGVPMMCCGAKMEELVPNTSDGAGEKHVPLAEVCVDCNQVTVNVGEVTHPSAEAHFIEWIYVQTTNGGQRKCLKAGDVPTATFKLVDEKAVAAYAYCNLHGLWKTSV